MTVRMFASIINTVQYLLNNDPDGIVFISISKIHRLRSFVDTHTYVQSLYLYYDSYKHNWCGGNCHTFIRNLNIYFSKAPPIFRIFNQDIENGQVNA